MKGHNFIDGKWVSGATATRDINPSNTADVVGEYAQADRQQAASAIASARNAFPKWSTGSIQARADILDAIGTEILARKEELGTLLSREEGKTRAEGIGEAARAGNIFKFFAGEALRPHGEIVPSVRPGIDVELTREPVGVVGMITPWNFPIAIPAWKIAPALAFGNCVVFKPAELVPGCAWAIADIISRTGLPPGVFNLVMGRGSVVGDAFVTSPDVDAITFTGSVPTGRRSRAAAIESRTKLQLEMGGKNPLVVLDDADLRCRRECRAAERLLFHRAALHRLEPDHRHGRHPRPLRQRAGRADEGAAYRRCAEGRYRDRPGRRPEPARPGSRIRRRGAEGRRQARNRRRAPDARHRRLLHGARAVHRDDGRDAHQPRGNLRPGRQRHPCPRLRRGAGDGQRHAVRPLRGHLHDLAASTRRISSATRRSAW